MNSVRSRGPRRPLCSRQPAPRRSAVLPDAQALAHASAEERLHVVHELDGHRWRAELDCYAAFKVGIFFPCPSLLPFT
jgi:hypothetical protein